MKHVLLGLASTVLLASVLNAQSTSKPLMKHTFVLVHGAWAGEFAWAKVRPLLEQAGHTVVTLDLLGHGADATPLAQITMEAYIAQVRAVVEQQPGKVTLVGHSMGGMVVSGVAEQIPDKIHAVVYLSAYLPQHGQDMQGISGTDTESAIGPNLEFAPDFSAATIKRESILTAFGERCTPADQQLILEKHRAEPLAPFQGKATVTAQGLGRVPKYYILTLHDKGVGTSLQRRMIAANGGVRQVFELESGHSPYFEVPAELVAVLSKLP